MQKIWDTKRNWTLHTLFGVSTNELDFRRNHTFVALLRFIRSSGAWLKRIIVDWIYMLHPYFLIETNPIEWFAGYGYIKVFVTVPDTNACKTRSTRKHRTIFGNIVELESVFRIIPFNVANFAFHHPTRILERYSASKIGYENRRKKKCRKSTHG